MHIKIAHLFPKQMNIYGDTGNIITLTKRLTWRGISNSITVIDETNIDVLPFFDIDIFFMGGGQDNEQIKVSKILQRNLVKQKILSEVNNDKVFLLICGGYQLFGRSYIGQNSEVIEGLDILPIETRALSNQRSDRCIGNIVLKTSLPINPQTLVGFENHSGQSIFIEDHPNYENSFHLGEVVYGYGDNAKDGLEGIKYKNVFGTYLHGSLLPKNPHFADYLIKKSLVNKYQSNINLIPLRDELEFAAHNKIVRNYTKGRG